MGVCKYVWMSEWSKVEDLEYCCYYDCFFYHWGEQKRQGQEGQDKGPVKEGRKEGRKEEKGTRAIGTGLCREGAEEGGAEGEAGEEKGKREKGKKTRNGGYLLFQDYLMPIYMEVRLYCPRCRSVPRG